MRAGSIVGSGTVSNKGIEKDGRMEWPKGYSCIAEKRCIETIQDGAPATEFMKFGDTIRIEMKGLDGKSLFGAIEQEIVMAGEVVVAKTRRGAKSLADAGEAAAGSDAQENTDS